MEIDKNIDRDLAENEPVGIVTSSLLFVVREHLRLDVALHITRAEQFLFQPQNWNGEWKVEFYVKRRRGQNHRPNRRRIIVHPRCHADAGKAVREHNHVFERDAVPPRNVAHKGVHILDHIREIIRRAALTRRLPVTTRVPCKNSDVVQA